MSINYYQNLLKKFNIVYHPQVFSLTYKYKEEGKAKAMLGDHLLIIISNYIGVYHSP